MSKVAYLFPGQGSQVVGMGQALAESFSIARLTFAEADEILGFRLSTLCFDGPADTLTATQNAQPAILTTSVAVLRVLQSERPELPGPVCVAGHSLGEYSALVAAGALDFADAVRLTRRRGELMAWAGSIGQAGGSMAAVLRLADEQVAAICEQASAGSGEVVQVANYNSPGQVVISGSAAGITAATELVLENGGRVKPLAVSIAAHSALMAPAAAQFAEHVAATGFQPPRLPVVGNVHVRPLLTVEEIREELVAQLTSSVQWTRTIAAMAEMGVDSVVELGPGTVLTGLVKRIDPALATYNVATPTDIAAVASGPSS